MGHAGSGMRGAVLGRRNIEHTRSSEARMVHQFARATIQSATDSAVPTTEIIFSHLWGPEV